MPDPHPPSALACPGCGRGYAADRLAHGRTFRCTCGARVGRRLETGLRAAPGEPRFAADVMLGKLARWLRALGYDAAWEPAVEDAELVRRGLEEGRLILTRDRRLAADWWVDSIVLVRADDPLEQLREVAAAVPLTRARIFTRCTHCNRALESAPDDEVRARVSPAIRERHADFSRCPACRRVYWKGGHVERMERALDGIVGE